MGKLTQLGWRQLDGLIEVMDEHGVMAAVETRVAEGETPSEIARSYGMPWSVMWKWIKADAKRLDAYNNALEARAELEAHRMLEIADGSDPESVVVDRHRTDVRKWLAGKWSKDKYGDTSKLQVDVRHQVDLAGALALAEERRARMIVGEATVVADVAITSSADIEPLQEMVI